MSTRERKRDKFASTFVSKMPPKERLSLLFRKRALRQPSVDLVSQVGSRLREQFGLRQLSLVELAGLRGELPSNSDAVRAYSQGLAKIRAFDALSARELLSHAVNADSSFPLAHSALAKAWSSLGYDSNARQEAKKALDGCGQSPA